MDVFDSRYFKINKFSLSCIGHWVHQAAAKKRFTRFLIFLLLTTALIPQLTFFFSVWGDMDAMCECISHITIVLVPFCHFGVFTFNEKKLRRLVNYIEEDWKYWSSRKELKILQSNAEHGRFFTLLYAMNLYSAVVTFVAMSLKPFFLDIWIPLNETRPKKFVDAAQFPFSHEKYFYWILVHGTITAFCSITVVFGCEAMLAVATRHVCGLFAIISCQLKNAMSLTNENKYQREETAEHEIHKEMSFAILWHNHALEFAETLNSCFSPLLCFTILLNVICISHLGIQTLNSIGDLTETIKFGSFAASIMLKLYLINKSAQNLLDRSTEVGNEAYNGCWYEMPIKFQKWLIPIIIRSQRPCTLTLGKVFTMNMIHFPMLLKTSLYYFTLLAALRE